MNWEKIEKEFKKSFYEKDAHPSEPDIIHRACGEDILSFFRQKFEEAVEEAVEEVLPEEIAFAVKKSDKTRIDGFNACLAEIKQNIKGRLK